MQACVLSVSCSAKHCVMPTAMSSSGLRASEESALLTVRGIRAEQLLQLSKMSPVRMRLWMCQQAYACIHPTTSRVPCMPGALTTTA